MKRQIGKKNKLSMPDVYVLLFFMVIVALLATYIVPAGEFERKTVNDMTVVVPDTYERVTEPKLGFMDMILPFQLGLVQSASIIFLILIMGGLIEVLEASGSLKAGILSAIKKTKGKEFLLISSICIIFSLLGAVGITANSIIAFVSIGVILAKSLKLDPIVAVAITFGAAFAGFNVGFANPYSIGIAHNIAELPLFSGILFRLMIFAVTLTITIWYTWRYTKRIMNDPNESFMQVYDHHSSEQKSAQLHFTFRHKLILLFVAIAFGFMIVATLKLEWTIDQMSAYFFAMAVGVGLLAKIRPNTFVTHFIKGAEKLVYGALIVGVARSVLVVLEEGKILDTIVYGLSILLTDLTPTLTAIAMLFTNAILNFLIPSGSGQAMVVMPIMTPLADMTGVTRQVAVQAFAFGDGFTNSIFPTSGPLMASLAVAGVPYTKWVRWMLPLLAIWFVIGIISLIIGVMINWGPM